MHRSATLPEILHERALRDPDRKAYVFLDDSGTETATLTYRELHRRSLQVAGRLVQQCRPGDRALLVFPQSADFIVAYFACLYARVVAVPVQPPRPDGPRAATLSIVSDCTPSAVLTVNAMLETARRAIDPVRALPWLVADDHAGNSDFDASVTPARCSVDDMAFLQYTSGSTSVPKGVMVTHGNLMANQRMIQRAFGHDRDSTVVGWAPFFHDQGLIGNVLQPLYVGATSVLMSPLTFIRRPIGWLSAISRYRAHTSGGPNFAFDACVARAENQDVSHLDLSCWKVAFNGAEPIRDDTLQRFSSRFSAVGFASEAFFPCYGLAEATLLVSASEKGRGSVRMVADADALAHKRVVVNPDPMSVGGMARTLVGCGYVLPDEDVRIVDPETSGSCPDDRVGEIWVSGDHVAQGYWGRPEQSDATFRAQTRGRDDCRYLRTGDLGVIVDGELFVVGRLKDMVIIRGVNYYPHDIEHSVQSAHRAVKPGGCAAVSVPGTDGERLVVVVEINREPAPTTNRSEIQFAIRAAITREHQVTVNDVMLVLPGQLEKTSSGKIMRSAARQRYLDNAFEIWVPQTPPLA
jgi:acyl-CoA synthetase (AMP-forming)/AMP-acid ligase II